MMASPQRLLWKTLSLLLRETPIYAHTNLKWLVELKRMTWTGPTQGTDRKASAWIQTFLLWGSSANCWTTMSPGFNPCFVDFFNIWLMSVLHLDANLQFTHANMNCMCLHVSEVCTLARKAFFLVSSPLLIRALPSVTVLLFKTHTHPHSLPLMRAITEAEQCRNALTQFSDGFKQRGQGRQTQTHSESSWEAARVIFTERSRIKAVRGEPPQFLPLF